MPEGPEIRRAADALSRALAGRTASRVEFAQPRLQASGEQLSGRRIDAVEAHGKALVLHFSGGQSIYTHNQLYGVWKVVAPNARPSSTRQLRLAIDNRTASALLYSASDIDVLGRDALARHPYLAKLGIDLLASATELAAVRAQIDAPRFQRRSLAALLLDQAFLAGIGNYLRSEILYVAGLRPDLNLIDLGDAARDRLARAALEITRQSYRTRGITNDLERAAALKRDGLAYGRYRHHVFDRAGETCWTCEATVEHRIVAGRNLFLCPVCQTDGG